jgi:chromosome segregation ATPase
MEQQELEKRISDLKGALEQSAAAHNALVGKGIELKSLIDLLPEQKEFLETRLNALQEEIAQSMANHNSLFGRLQENQLILDKLVSPPTE